MRKNLLSFFLLCILLVSTGCNVQKETIEVSFSDLEVIKNRGDSFQVRVKTNLPEDIFIEYQILSNPWYLKYETINAKDGYLVTPILDANPENSNYQFKLLNKIKEDHLKKYQLTGRNVKYSMGNLVITFSEEFRFRITSENTDLNEEEVYNYIDERIDKIIDYNGGRYSPEWDNPLAYEFASEHFQISREKAESIFKEYNN